MIASIQFSVRNLQPEEMDRPDLDSKSHYSALEGLARLNRWSCSTSAIWRPLAGLAHRFKRPLRVLDIAAGGGDVLCGLAIKARQAKLDFDFSGCDISSRAVEFAQQRAHNHKLAVSFFTLDVLQDPLPYDFDVMISSLFLHHLQEEQAHALLGKMMIASQEMILISDLRRSRLGLCLAYAATQLLTRSSVVHIDGPLSVRNAFTMNEVRNIAERAGLAQFEIRKCWPQRFLLRWQREQCDQ